MEGDSVHYHSLKIFVLVVLALQCGAVWGNEADLWIGVGDDRQALFDTYVARIKSGHVLSERGFQRLGITWERELARAQTLFMKAEQPDDVYYAVVALLCSLHTSHTTLRTPPQLVPQHPPVALPLTIQVRGRHPGQESYVVTESSHPMIRPGFLVETYDGKSLPDMEYAYLQWFRGSSPELLKLELATYLTRRSAARKYPIPSPGTSVTIRFREPETTTFIEMQVPWTRDWHASTRKSPSRYATDYEAYICDYRGFNYRIYPLRERKVLLLLYSSFRYKPAMKDLHRMFANTTHPLPPWERQFSTEQQHAWFQKLVTEYHYPELSELLQYPITPSLMGYVFATIDMKQLLHYLQQQSEYTRLLIDLRENGGGQQHFSLLSALSRERFCTTERSFAYTPLMKTEPHIFQESLQMADTWMQEAILAYHDVFPDASTSPRYPFFCQTPNCDLSEACLTPETTRKEYITAVLAGPRTLSSADQFLAIFKDNNMGHVVGLPSGGGSAPFRTQVPFVLNNGEHFFITLVNGITYRPNGEPLEGNPSDVDYYLYPEEAYLETLMDVIMTLEKQNGNIYEESM